MISLFIFIIALPLFVFSVVRIFQKRFKASFVLFLLSMTCIVTSIFTSGLGQAVFGIAALNKSITGDAMDGIEAYKREIKIKCQGAVLEQCSQASQPIEAIQTSMF